MSDYTDRYREGTILERVAERPELEDKFWDNVDFKSQRWVGGICKPTGYGQLALSGRMFPAHQIVLALTEGVTIEKGYHAHHTCKYDHDFPYRECVNPDHIEVLTLKEHRAADKALDEAHGVVPKKRKKNGNA